MRVGIVDYRAGNLASVVKALRAVDAEPVIVSSREDLTGARAIVIPGVGHFQATAVLDSLRADLDVCIAEGVPTLGICLGMQWLFDGSEEAISSPGLGWFAGRCARLRGWRPSKSTLLFGRITPLSNDGSGCPRARTASGLRQKEIGRCPRALCG